VSESSQSPEPSSERKPARGRGSAAPDQVSQSSGSSGRKPRRRLAPSEKYEVFVQVLTQQATQREAAEKWDRSTVIGICRTAKRGALDALAAAVPGRSGRSAEQVELEAARAEIARLRATVTEQAVVLHLQQGKAPWG
jgi:hypothetical protein